jgi:hypothetical protein
MPSPAFISSAQTVTSVDHDGTRSPYALALVV